MDIYQKVFLSQHAGASGFGQDIQEPWARLISLNPNYPNLSLYLNQYLLGRRSTSHINFQDSKISSIHCKISRDTNGCCWVEDYSLNGTFIENNKVGKGQKLQLSSGQSLNLLISNKGKNASIEYIFSAKITDDNSLKRGRGQEIIYLEESPSYPQKNTKTRESLNPNKPCDICKESTYQCITIQNCLHSFCAGCFSQWILASQDCLHCKIECSNYFKDTPHVSQQNSSKKLHENLNAFNSYLLTKSEENNKFNMSAEKTYRKPTVQRGKGLKNGRPHNYFSGRREYNTRKTFFNDEEDFAHHHHNENLRNNDPYQDDDAYTSFNEDREEDLDFNEN